MEFYSILFLPWDEHLDLREPTLPDLKVYRRTTQPHGKILLQFLGAGILTQKVQMTIEDGLKEIHTKFFITWSKI